MGNIVLRVKDLQAGYEGQAVLRSVSFSVQQGEMVGIIGPNGAGKSTLLQTLRGFLPAQQGDLELQGRPAASYGEREFARAVGYLQQQVDTAMGCTVKQLVLAGRYPYLHWWQHERSEDEAVVRACMEYTGIAALAERKLQAISGGQRQRVLLAKVLAQQTPLLFLDEPASSLDVFYQEEIFRFCREFCSAGKTVLLVAHELSLAARFCSRLLLVGKGAILADGTPAEVLTEAALSEAYGVEVKVIKNPLTGNVEIGTLPPPRESRKGDLLRQILGEI